MIKAATWNLPQGHTSVGAFATVEEAQNAARARVGDGAAYYVMDKRGAWEVIRYNVPAT